MEQKVGVKLKYPPYISKVGGFFFLSLVLAGEQEKWCEIGFDRGFAPVEVYGGWKPERA